MPKYLECQLCPKYCRIPEGGAGDCRIRMHIDGKLLASTWGLPCSAHMDPIEKKPLFHFLPGSPILSIATVGCNLHCRNCQNHEISQANPEDSEAFELPPDRLVEVTRREGAPSIAYTYTEPLTYYEYTHDCCVAAREAGLRNVLVSAGYINQKPLRRLLPYVDAANIDLKGFTEQFYKDNCGATLRPILAALETCVEMGVWLEVTNLVIPTLNDDMELIRKMCRWMAKHLGPTVPLHFSRFHPQFKLRNLPPTPGETLEQARDVAFEEGLKFVYVGNLKTRHGESTFCHNEACPGRQRPLVVRVGFSVEVNRIAHGKCPDCGTVIPGVWDSSSSSRGGETVPGGSASRDSGGTQ
jgi:pyruvate formate lyase activating enzyme